MSPRQYWFLVICRLVCWFLIGVAGGILLGLLGTAVF